MSNNYAKFQFYALAGLFVNWEDLYCIFVKNSLARTTCVLPMFCKQMKESTLKSIVHISNWDFTVVQAGDGIWIN